jgi:hypothetical protein
VTDPTPTGDLPARLDDAARWVPDDQLHIADLLRDAAAEVHALRNEKAAEMDKIGMPHGTRLDVLVAHHRAHERLTAEAKAHALGAEIANLKAEVRALRDQQDTAVGALREIEADDVYMPTLGGLGQFRANTLATVRRALAAVDRPPTSTPDTGDDT